MSRQPRIAVLDYGSGNLRSAQRALARAGADAEITADQRSRAGRRRPGRARRRRVRGLHGRPARGRAASRSSPSGWPPAGRCWASAWACRCCSGPGWSTASARPAAAAGRGWSSGSTAPVLPHMGWNTVRPAPGSRLFAGMDDEQMFYFVHSYAVLQAPPGPALVTWATHGEPFVAAVEGRAAGRHPVPPRVGTAGERGTSRVCGEGRCGRRRGSCFGDGLCARASGWVVVFADREPRPAECALGASFFSG